MPTYLRGCCPAAALISSVPRTALTIGDDWRLDAVGGPADPEMVENAWSNIERDGWTIVGSFTRSFLYSAGLTSRGWPELVIRVGGRITIEVAGALLCEVVRVCEAENRPPVSSEAMLVSGFDVRFVPVADRLAEKVCAVTFALYGGRSMGAVEAVTA